MEIFFAVLAALVVWWWIKNFLATLIVGEATKDQMTADRDTQELREACCAAIENNVYHDDYQLLRTEIITRQSEREFGWLKQLLTRNAVIDNFIDARIEFTVALWSEAEHSDE